MVRLLVEQDGIQFPANAITIPEERANRYLVRTVKGLLTQFHPQFDTDALVTLLPERRLFEKAFGPASGKRFCHRTHLDLDDSRAGRLGARQQNSAGYVFRIEHIRLADALLRPA